MTPDLAMPLLRAGDVRSDVPAIELAHESARHQTPSQPADAKSTHDDAPLELVGGWGRMQRRAAAGAMLVEANFVTLVFTAVILLPRWKATWHLDSGDAAIAATSFFAGTFFGQFVIGAIADRIGRRAVLLIALPCGYIATLMVFACESVGCVAMMRGLGGFFIGGALIASYVTFFELTLQRDRFFAKMLMVLGGWTTPGLFVVGVAFALREASWHWVLLGSLIPSPLALVCLTIESPQFLVAHGRRDEALQTLEKMAIINRCKVSQLELTGSVDRPAAAAPSGGRALSRTASAAAASTAAASTHADLAVPATRLSHQRERWRQCGRLALVSAAWIGSVCVYYGVVLWPLHMSESLYLTTALGLLLEVSPLTACYFTCTPTMMPLTHRLLPHLHYHSATSDSPALPLANVPYAAPCTQVPVYLLLPLSARALGSATNVWAFVLLWCAARI
jgi:MFS family permease